VLLYLFVDDSLQLDENYVQSQQVLDVFSYTNKHEKQNVDGQVKNTKNKKLIVQLEIEYTNDVLNDLQYL
jgi:hypothetical protein